MVRLETVEDFEKAKKALKNYNSQPWEYRVRPHGYCTFCFKITEFVPACDSQMFAKECLNCKSNFEVPGTGEES